MHRDPAADHMACAMKAIYASNSSPFVHRYPSGGVFVPTGEPDVFANFAIGLEGPEWGDAIERFGLVDAPSAIMTSTGRDEAFEAHLVSGGFEFAAAIPAMRVSLSEVADAEVPEGYRFERVTSTDRADSWAKVLSEGYPVARLAAESMSPVCARVDDASDAPLQYFTLAHGDELAGVSALCLADGVAGVYCVTTMSEHRRKGLGAVLTVKPLQVAKSLGYSTGVLQASEAGYGIYKKIGFEDSGAVQLYLKGVSVH